MDNKIFNIVLFAPQIPQNTGNIGRLCVCAGAKLHLIKPLGFSLEEKYILRAGMDYWKYVDLTVHDTFEDLLKIIKKQKSNFYFLSTKTKKSYLECPYKDGDFLIFGNEGTGLPTEIYEFYQEQLFNIPMPGQYARSLNLSNSVAIVLYQALQT
jgi:tRNA (cytidine/uridine-2'-O-)-methyltransferase